MMETRNLFDTIRSSPPKSTEVDTTAAASKDGTVYRPECNSPEPSCAICLGKLENKSFTDSCFHQFCFTCLLEWSKVKAECPLCKQSFKSIIHNVRSIEDYDQYHLRAAEEPPRSWESPDGWRFRYRSTLTSERRREMALERRLLGHHVSRSASCLFRNLRSHRPSAVTTDFRRNVYDRNWWVHPMELTRYRDVSPQFYRSNPACTHRLIPWLNRELVVLLHERESRVSYVLEFILSLIQRCEILSAEFREHVRPYVFGRTEHFIHEFYNFARCPWDMRAYDQRAKYRDLQVTRSSSDSNDSDIIIVDTPTPGTSENVQNGGSSNLRSSGDQPNSATASEEPMAAATTQPDAHNPEPPSGVSALDRVKNFLSNVGRTGWESPSTSAPGWESPTRASSTYGELPHMNNIPFLPSSPQPGPSGMTHFLQPVPDDSDSNSSELRAIAVNLPFLDRGSGAHVTKKEPEDDCLIVACVKPTRERTPPMVDLVSDSDNDSVMHVKHEPEENDVLSRSSRSRRTRSRSSSSSSVTQSTPRSSSRSLVGSSSRSRTREPDELSSASNLPNDIRRSKRLLPPPPHTFAPRRTSHSSSPSPDRWRWTAYENGGGKLQRSFSRSSSGEPSHPRLSSVVGEVHGMLAKHKKHKKHKHKHKSHHHHHRHRDSKHKFKKHCKGHKNSSKSHH